MSEIVLTDRPDRMFGQETGLRGQTGALVMAAVRQRLTDYVEDHVVHAKVVASGLPLWKRTMDADFGAFFSGNRSYMDDLSLSTFRFLQETWKAKVRHPRWIAKHGGWSPTPTEFLDSIDIKSEPTKAEVDAAWQVDIGSSDSAMREMYEGSARVRTGSDWGLRNRSGERGSR